MVLKVKKIREEAVLPKYAHPGDAGMDVCSCVDCILKPGERMMVTTGLAFEVPYGYELQTRPRSGLALRNGISIVNTPGTLDAGYRGELGIILINHGQEDFEIKKGERIAQAVINKVELVDIEEAEVLSESERGTNGFGSSGKS